MTDSEQIRTFLNASGYPFQQYCGLKLSQLDHFQVSAEVPITHPKTVGANLGVHSAIDLVAARQTNYGMLIFFIIECKKANDKVKNWILLQNQLQDPRWPTFAFSKANEQEPFVLGITRSVTFPALGYVHSADYDFCINGIEANTALSAMNREQAEKIYNSLKQAMHGTYAFESTYPKVVEGINYLRDAQSITSLYVPVVITTANIYTPSIVTENITHGEIPPDSFELGELRKWASFEFALPDYLSYGAGREGGNIYLPKRTAFIVNDKHMDEFFKGAAEPATTFEAPPV
jgi:hypothetical protein